MDPVTTPIERALHLLLFVSAAAAVGVVGIGALERLVATSRRTVRALHVVVAGLLVGGFFVAERVYHAVH